MFAMLIPTRESQGDRRTSATLCVAVGLFMLVWGPLHAQSPPQASPWTVDSALEHCKLYPKDTYAQFVALQLARREGADRLREVVEALQRRPEIAIFAQDAQRDVDLLSFTSGSLAVQESLQLDTMTADTIPRETNEDTARRLLGRPSSRPRHRFNGSASDRNNLNLLALSLLNYESAYGRLPPAAYVKKQGDPKVSWRVRLLPYMEEQSLYGEYRQDEPWDSPHNKTLLSRMPDVFRASNMAGKDATSTTFRVPTGERTLFDSGRGVQLRQIIDGTSNTVVLMQVAAEHATPWTKPDGVEIHFDNPFKGAFTDEMQWLNVATMDGAVMSLPKTMGAKTFANLLKRDDRTVIDWTAVYRNAPPREASTAGPSIDINTLTGPTIQSHPFAEMLGGKSPRLSRLAGLVPYDYYFVHSRSAEKLLTLAGDYQALSSELARQAFAQNNGAPIVQRLLNQLAFGNLPKKAEQLDSVVDEIAIVGSDVYLTKGADVTVLLSARQGATWQSLLDINAASLKQQHSGIELEDGEYAGIAFTHATTPQHTVHVYATTPQPGLHVRSNSLVAFRRVLDTFAATADQSAPDASAASLGSTDEFRYVRTLFESGADEEEVFVYLSDPFIRNLVGPASKITELRRRQCFNHLQIIEHASLLYEQEHGQRAESVEQLVRSKCLPKGFVDESIRCPDRGEYQLAETTRAACCSRHGCKSQMAPCCEVLAQRVTADEKQLYDEFLENYNQYWRTFFDPIAIRIRHQPQASRIETIVLPLLDNSIYTTAAEMLGGEPVAISGAPTSDQVVLSLGVTFDKQQLVDAKPEAIGANQLNRLKQVALGVLNFESVHRHLPPSKKKGSQLSWRVHILPYLEQQPLYDRFHLDEPWDSPHNKKLLDEMPAIYGDKGTETTIQGFAGEGVFGQREQPLGLRNLTDGPSNTLLAIDAQSAESVPWTKPEDLPFDPEEPLKALGQIDPQGMAVVFNDGFATILPADTSADDFKAFVTYKGGEVVNRQNDTSPRRRARLMIRERDVKRTLSAFGASEQQVESLDVGAFLNKGLGSHVSFHVYDAEPTFSFNSLRFAGQLIGGSRGLLGSQLLFALPFVNSLNAPVYSAWSLDDTAVVDDFLMQLDKLLATAVRDDRSRGFVSVNYDFYRLSDSEHPTRCFAWDFFGFRFRTFYSRVADHLIIATQPDIIQDLAASSSQPDSPLSANTTGHIQLRIQPQHWSRLLQEMQLTWAEAARNACLHNLGPLNSAGRAASDPVAAAQDAFNTKYECPCGGHYQKYGSDGSPTTSVVCSIHGDATQPQQAAQVPSESVAAAMNSSLGETNATLTFTEHGLRAVIEIERQPAE